MGKVWGGATIFSILGWAGGYNGKDPKNMSSLSTGRTSTTTTKRIYSL